jgi:Ni/Fe-hydrogenase subunit HybB-like protein
VASRDWWIGIAHGGLLVSAVLLLLGVEWRCAVSRIAETVALLGAVAAGFYGVLLFGRPGPVDPAHGGLGPPFGSAAAWEMTGIACFLVVCLSLWAIGLLPDLAVLRDRAAGAASPRRRHIYGRLAWGWRGSALQWQRWIEAYRAVALLGALLVVVLQTGASVRLAASAPPGGRDALLPVTFLVDAVLSGVGVTATLVVLLRAIHGLGGLITRRHLDVLARMILVLGLAGLFCHVTEILTTLLHGEAFAREVVARGAGGDLAWIFWTIVACGLLPVQVFWLPRARRSTLAIALVGLLVAVGAYADHVMILIVTSQPGAGSSFTMADALGVRSVATFAGSVGLVLALLLLCLRSLPIVSIAQTRELAVTHNGASALAQAGPMEERPTTGLPARWIGAVFTSEKGLAAATRALHGRDRTLRLDAHGPVPMPGLADVLRPAGPPMRRIALAGALVGGGVFLALCLWLTLWLDPPVGASPPWAAASLVFVGPSVMAAMVAGTLVVILALFARTPPAPGDDSASETAGFLDDNRDRYVLLVEIADGADPADRIAGQLAAFARDAGRPMAIRRLAP